jgi:hypothetical protein
MSATFRVEDSFYLAPRRAYVLRGQILAGEVRRGMFVRVGLNDGVDISAPIDAVEFVDRPGGVSAIGLLMRCEDEVERAMWEGLTSPGEELSVTDHDPAA